MHKGGTHRLTQGPLCGIRGLFAAALHTGASTQEQPKHKEEGGSQGVLSPHPRDHICDDSPSHPAIIKPSILNQARESRRWNRAELSSRADDASGAAAGREPSDQQEEHTLDFTVPGTALGRMYAPVQSYKKQISKLHHGISYLSEERGAQGAGLNHSILGTSQNSPWTPEMVSENS